MDYLTDLTRVWPKVIDNLGHAEMLHFQAFGPRYLGYLGRKERFRHWHSAQRWCAKSWTLRVRQKRVGKVGKVG